MILYFSWALPEIPVSSMLNNNRDDTSCTQPRVTPYLATPLQLKTSVENATWTALKQRMKKWRRRRKNTQGRPIKSPGRDLARYENRKPRKPLSSILSHKARYETRKRRKQGNPYYSLIFPIKNITVITQTWKLGALILTLGQAMWRRYVSFFVLYKLTTSIRLAMLKILLLWVTTCTGGSFRS